MDEKPFIKPTEGFLRSKIEHDLTFTCFDHRRQYPIHTIVEWLDEHTRNVLSEGIFLIEEGWIDPMENRVADGYDPIGFVNTLEEAEKIVTEGGHYTPDDCWSAQYYPNGMMPKFKYTKLPKL